VRDGKDFSISCWCRAGLNFAGADKKLTRAGLQCLSQISSKSCRFVLREAVSQRNTVARFLSAIASRTKTEQRRSSRKATRTTNRHNHNNAICNGQFQISLLHDWHGNEPSKTQLLKKNEREIARKGRRGCYVT